MSIKTWKAEFYPKRANQVSKRDAVSHSLLKWRGLRKSNLAKHRVQRNFYGDLADGDDPVFCIDAETCALCVHYIGGECRDCPLFKAMGGKSCAGSGSVFEKWVEHGDPMPMIKALEEANRAQTGKLKAKQS